MLHLKNKQAIPAGSGGLFLVLWILLFNIETHGAGFRVRLAGQCPTGVTALDRSARSCIEGTKVYFVSGDDWDAADRKLKIHTVDTENCSTGVFIIPIPEAVVIYDLPEICINGHYLLMIDDNEYGVHVFEKTKDSFSYKHTAPKPGRDEYTNAVPMNDGLFLLSKIYNSHPEDKMNDASVAIYNAVENKFNTVINPSLPCVAFSHIYANWVDGNGSSVAIANPCGYKVGLYDITLWQKVSINHQPPGWKDPAGLKLPFVTDVTQVHPKILIDSLLSYENLISRIERIYFTSPTQLLVSSIQPGLGDSLRLVDIWDTDKGKLNASAVYPVRFSDTQNIDTGRMPLPLSNRNVHFNGKKIIALMPEIFSGKDGQYYADYASLKDQSYETKDPEFSILIHEMVFE